jgi:polyhydroxyalkanoate synthesis regulator phasin
MKKLLTLVAGYAAGLAVAMKYRKDAGRSKLTTDPSKSKVDAFIDEVVDIHKTAYGDAREYVTTNLDDVKDLPTLKEKATEKMSSLMDEADTLYSSLKKKVTSEKQAIEQGVEDLIEKKDTLEDEAKAKASSLSDTIVDKLATWIE